ncbi:hypothetical protein KY290_007547 [Solanum tuberosum]|uniref:Uncharacterized protein n=1 Tax=Solanum tuberosum TaxID=4113 RepID=A0ABQ7W5V4_SOLTU|nr:hypothetical protein KY290_007547 [Solanum tuberosum]
MTKSEERRTHEDWEIQSCGTTTESTQGNNKVSMELFPGKEGNEEETEHKKWANLFHGNCMATQGMKLNYVAPTVCNREKIVELCKEDVEL